MKKLIIMSIMTLAGLAVSAQPQVIAHRGFHATDGSARNSIAALEKAQKLGVFGSECDVNLSKDGEVLVVHGDWHPKRGEEGAVHVQRETAETIRAIKLENGETRVVLRLPEALAPVKLCVMPLVKKDGLPEVARKIIDDLKFHFNCQYDEKDTVGKRYRRQDAIGTPYCVTVDYDTLKDNTVTLRFRDTMKQERVSIDNLRSIIEDKVSIYSLLKKLQ